MIFVFGILSLFFISITARATPKIEIFEIRESKSGLELKNLNTNSKNHHNSDSLLKLLRNPKTDNQATKFARQLLSKLKSLRGEEKSNRFGDDAHIYILNSDVLDDDSSYEEFFIDKTRNDRTNNDIRDVLLQLFQPDRKLTPLKRKKLRQAFKRPSALRSDDIVEDRTMVPIHRNKYEYNDSKGTGSDM